MSYTLFGSGFMLARRKKWSIYFFDRKWHNGFVCSKRQILLTSSNQFQINTRKKACI